VEKVLIDTSAAVAIERGAGGLVSLLENKRILVPQVVVAELLTAIGLAPTEEHKSQSRQHIEAQLREFERVDFGDVEAEILAQLRAHCIRAGRRRGENDLMIASHAIAERAVLLTADKRARFDDLPGVIAQHI
jgi:tRNA(fMet)-specific endonuclease VapC